MQNPSSRWKIGLQSSGYRLQTCTLKIKHGEDWLSASCLPVGRQFSSMNDVNVYHSISKLYTICILCFNADVKPTCRALSYWHSNRWQKLAWTVQCWLRFKHPTDGGTTVRLLQMNCRDTTCFLWLGSSLSRCAKFGAVNRDHWSIMSDYLSTGGVRAPEILVDTGRRTSSTPVPKDELFLEGYGRQFGEILDHTWPYLTCREHMVCRHGVYIVYTGKIWEHGKLGSWGVPKSPPNFWGSSDLTWFHGFGVKPSPSCERSDKTRHTTHSIVFHCFTFGNHGTISAPFDRENSDHGTMAHHGTMTRLPRKMTYSIGLTYGAGLLTGGFYGGLLGIRQGGATPKLFLNSVLNSCSRYGPALANQSAIITMYYAPWWTRSTSTVDICWCLLPGFMLNCWIWQDQIQLNPTRSEFP